MQQSLRPSNLFILGLIRRISEFHFTFMFCYIFFLNMSTNGGFFMSYFSFPMFFVTKSHVFRVSKSRCFGLVFLGALGQRPPRCLRPGGARHGGLRTRPEQCGGAHRGQESTRAAGWKIEKKIKGPDNPTCEVEG